MPLEIIASYDEQGIYVYQAYNHNIAAAALRTGTFGEGFLLDRMTWIKPSFTWMLYRSGFARKPNQEVILQIKLVHEGWKLMLRNAVPSTFTNTLYPHYTAWQEALNNSDARYQWDPARNYRLERIQTERALQVGLRGSLVERYVREWIIGVTDVTHIAKSVEQTVYDGKIVDDMWNERVYPVDTDIRLRLQMDK